MMNRNKGKPTQNIALIGFADLMAMYDFLKEEYKCYTGQSRVVVHDKMQLVKKELHERTYGYNPHEIENNTTSIDAMQPEKINLDKFNEKEDK